MASVGVPPVDTVLIMRGSNRNLLPGNINGSCQLSSAYVGDRSCWERKGVPVSVRE